ncbi:hypothetical protein LZ554_002642 [Drepanopeziza brunnea f. sp. 'monogermtubi']|nr:hypothetical protein LZ554_002642 [Drepanopeziza brunnea f. sp. 'monogermtubi']
MVQLCCISYFNSSLLFRNFSIQALTKPYRLTASEALPLLRSGELTVETYATSLLARIKLRDYVVKAWAVLHPGFVLEQARNLDQISAEERGPLHGIPVGIEDLIFTKDTTPITQVLEAITQIPRTQPRTQALCAPPAGACSPAPA